MDPDLEEFCDACGLMGAARRSFRGLAANESDNNERDNSADIRMLVRALNEATYRYVSAVSKFRESLDRD
ncbi:hypothetical protein [Paraburkholderia ferrariae]|uniref:Uncharacterized protein n=1 Tax=Paraburkholderia ferrariae TaxID=386056 RepID=A0ABU9RUM8_9BURK